MNFAETYTSGFCEAGNHRQCRQHFCGFGRTEPTTCTCICHRLQGFIHQLGEKTAAEILAERCERCQ